MTHAQSLLFPCLTSPAHSTHSVPQTLLSLRDAQPDTPRHERLFGRPADQNSLTGYEPKDLIEVNDTEVTPTLFHRPSMTSTYDSAQSIATPPLEADLDDEQIKAMLASPLYRQEREKQVQTNQLVYHSDRENSVSSSSRGETCSSVLTQEKVESRISLRQRRYFLGTSSSSRRKRIIILTL